MRVNQSNNNSPSIGNAQQSEVSSARNTSKAATASGVAGKKTDKSSSASSTASGAGAHATISDKGRDLAKAKAVATSAPDVREERVAELKRRIAEGRYQVDANAVADRMVDEHLRTADLG